MVNIAYAVVSITGPTLGVVFGIYFYIIQVELLLIS
jgi:hypothetical protein